MVSRIVLLFLLAACTSSDAPDDSKGSDTGNTSTADCVSEGRDVCDGVDNDCDGIVDEDGATVFYRDEDGDGYGAASVSVLSCETSLPGYVADYSDCSDVDASIFPSAPEYCDGKDHDCDGQVYEDSSVDVEPWYSDEDGDGYGGTVDMVEACVGPEGYSASNADCDDADEYISPRAVEICDDGNVDEDCDGLVNANDDWAAGGDPYYIDRDGDRYGDASTLPEWLCERPDDYVVNNDDCDDFDDDVSPSGFEICNTMDDDCNGVIDDGVCDTGGPADTGDTGGIEEVDTGVSIDTGDTDTGVAVDTGDSTTSADSGVSGDTGSDTGAPPISGFVSFWGGWW